MPPFVGPGAEGRVRGQGRLSPEDKGCDAAKHPGKPGARAMSARGLSKQCCSLQQARVTGSGAARNFPVCV